MRAHSKRTSPIALITLALYLALGTHALAHSYRHGAGSDACATCQLARTPGETTPPLTVAPPSSRSYQPMVPRRATPIVWLVNVQPRGPPLG